MKKKMIAFLMAAAMLLACLTGCAAKEEAPAADAPAADGDTTLTLGLIGPMTGGYANYGTSTRNGAQIAVDAINAAGGVNGMTFELLVEDSEGDPESAVNAYGKLVDNGMEVSLGAVFSGEMASVSAAAAEDDIFMMGATCSADKCIATNDNAFRVCFYDSYQGTAAADYIADNGLATEVSIFYESDYDYSVGLYDAFVAECEVKGITVKETQTFTTGTNTDFSTQINALAAADTKVVFLPIYAEEASTFLTQAKGKFADDVYFFGADGLDGILGKVEQDVSLANNVMMLTPYSADDPAEDVQSFVKAYQEKYSATPDQFAADGYDAVYIIKALIEKGGFKAPAECTAEAMVKQVLELEYDGVTGNMTWDEAGNTSKAALAVIYKDGAGSIFSK